MLCFFGWLSYYGFDGKKNELYYEYLFKDCHNSDIWFIYYFQHFIATICSLILVWILYIFTNYLHISFILSLLCCGIASFGLYKKEQYGNEQTSSQSQSCLFNGDIFGISFKALIPLIFGQFVYIHIQSYPFALVRAFIETNQFGFAIGILDFAIVCGQIISSTLYIAMFGFIATESIEEETDDEVIHYYMLFIAPAMLISTIISFVLIFLQKMEKMNVRPIFNEDDETLSQSSYQMMTEESEQTEEKPFGFYKEYNAWNGLEIIDNLKYDK